MGVCKHSSSSGLDNLVRQRFLYDLSLQLLDPQKMLNFLLELSNYPVTETCDVIFSITDTFILDTLAVVDSTARLANRLIYEYIPITTVIISHDCATEHRHITAYSYHMSGNALSLTRSLDGGSIVDVLG